MTTRRDILRGGAAFGGAGLLSAALPGFSASAQTANGYKALVCVFLAGGMDGHDAVIPMDQASYGEWATTRARLLELYAGNEDDSRTRGALQALGSQTGGMMLGMPRQMGALADRYAEGRMAVMANVGPLVTPTTADDARQKRVPLPARLMSHNDQQSTWQALAPEGAASGWGGRMRDLMDAQASPFSAVSVSGNPVFLAGEASAPFVMSRSGVRQVHGTGGNFAYGSREVPAAFEAHLSASAASMDSWIASDFQATQRRNLSAVNDLAALTNATTVGEDVAIPDNNLSSQLAVVAKIISLRGQLGLNRQVFFVKIGGFDTHDNQHTRLPGRQAEIAEAMSSFYEWTRTQGIAEGVTTFTASDFGRTLTTNASGTDHGWGNHHFALGGAVRGGRIVGSVPPAVEGHTQDFGRGRMVPTTATLQYAGALGSWFGLNQGQLRDVLPGLERFDGNAALF